MHNPFSQFRAENMGMDLWKLYVPGPFSSVLTPRPLVLEGGRGSGKTMFFLCNSWEQQLKSVSAEGTDITRLFSPPYHIGLYYKVDTAFVTSMDGRGLDDWDGIFSTYLGVSIGKEILHLLQYLAEEGVVGQTDIRGVLRHFGNLMSCGDVVTVDRALDICEDLLDAIERLINNPTLPTTVQGTVIGRFVHKVVQSVRTIPALKHAAFRVFIDEYETLLEKQQRLVNTLIKHSTDVLVYNIGMRPKGMLTQRTSGQSEIIQAPHDYHVFRPETVLDTEDGTSHGPYFEYVREVCKKRFQAFKSTMGLPSLPEDIEWYLGRYEVEDEIVRIVGSKRTPPFLGRLRALIRTLAPSADEAKFYQRLLADEAHPLHARLHLCLLLRQPRYRPELTELSENYLNWKAGKTDGKYATWLHNAKLGLVFLLSRDYRHPKLYYGADVFAMLSSGVIRYFLELCEQAFEFAKLDNSFSWDSPRPITADEQSKAARYVSNYKVKDIHGYEPYGRALRVFVENLGNAYKALHIHPKTTLGEPEPNHFCTSDLGLDDASRKVLNSSVMWAVLQERGATKEKNIDQPDETVDYHLNHIYCPYFGISYRQKRKLTITPDRVGALVSGDEALAKEAARSIIVSRRGSEMEVDMSVNGHQLTFFDGVEDRD